MSSVPSSKPSDAERPLAGVLLCDKPAGVTSHDVVAGLRRERGVKVGHAGTLDPFATGLLLALLGRATRLQRYLMPLPKTYIATARLGWRSSTGDPDGELRETGRVPEHLALPTGAVEQQLPMTSAVRVDGERLYRRAHRGEEVQAPRRVVQVHRAELVEQEGDRATFEIQCSSGTYVRVLIETLADAYCERLRRVAIGPFRLGEAGPAPLSVERALSFLPELELDAEQARRASNGVAVPVGAKRAILDSNDDSPATAVRLTHRGGLIAVARPEEGGLRPEVVLA
jgi:tRNA pseudouridine55 synthase